jgi:branched-chain amino acid transport system permease protein
MQLILGNLLNGLTMAALLFILSSGFTLVLGLMGTLNLAHGALYMVGAYVGLTLASEGWNFFLVCFLCGLISGVIGFIIERGFLRRLRRQELMQILLTIGFVYIFTNLVQWIWGGIALSPFTPAFLSGAVGILETRFPINRFAIMITALLIGIGLWFFEHKTRAGAIVRAGMDNSEMTTALGINLDLTYSAIFFLSAFMAGIAGIIGAPLMGANPELGMDVLTFALIVVVIGGLGSLEGALLASVIVGTIDAFGRAFIPELAMFTMYLVMIIILLIRPAGLMKGRLM